MFYHRIHKKAAVCATYIFTTNENTCQLLGGPNALWPTQPKFSVGVAHPAHRAASSGSLYYIYTYIIFICSVVLLTWSSR